MQPPATAVDSAAADALLREHEPLVRRAARLVAVRWGMPAMIDEDDLRQVGRLALLDAAARWDAASGATLRTWADRRIVGAMIDAIRDAQPLSRQHRARRRSVEQARERLAHRLGRLPRLGEIAAELGISIDAADEPSPWAVAVDPDDPALADADADPARLYEIAQRAERLAAAIGALTMRQAAAVAPLLDAEHFGGRAAAQTAEALGVTASRISHLRADAVRRLSVTMRGC